MQQQQNQNKRPMAPLIGISIVAIGFAAAVVPFFPKSLKLKTLHLQLPFQGTTSLKIEHIAKLLDRHAAESVSSASIRSHGKLRRKEFLDIGVGDGRILLKLSESSFLKRQFDVYRGIEINSTLYWICKFRTLFKRNIFIEKRDFFLMTQQDLANVDAVFIFGIPGLMEKFRDRLESRLRPGAIVLTNKFPLPERTPLYREGEISLYIIDNS